ncbi:MAG: zinc ABC transporter solute-binding protein [Planctomycetia bacterium]|nr:zinc ABC transporter solute-binding protein [Planctomycetia bacterium]
MGRDSNRFFAFLILLLLLGPGQIFAEDSIRVVTTTPDLADIVRQVGGDRVTVTSLTRGSEDFHKVRPRPRLLNSVYRADLLVQIGLDLEHSWLPQLLDAVRNPRIKPGTSGFVNCSAGIVPLDIPVASTRKEGPDLHLKGNPHYNLSPIQGRRMVTNIIEGLCRKSPQHCEEFQKRGAEYLKKLDEKIADWKQRLKPFEGASFIEYHPTWSYFAKDFGLKIADRIEAKAGVTPHATQLAKVMNIAKQKNVGLIISRPATLDLALKIASNCEATALVLPHSSSESGTLQGYIPFMEHVVRAFEGNLRLVQR